MLTQLRGEKQPTAATTSHDNPHVRRIQAEHQYCPPDPDIPRRRVLPHSITALPPHQSAGPGTKRAAPDGVLNYASAVLNDGLLLLEFKDAIREGDGKRILRCWKAMILYFRYAGHTNYLSEAITTLILVDATASSRISHQLTWSQVVNTRGGAGHSVPVDLHMERLNRTVKDYVGTLSGNISESTILQCGKSLGGIQKMCSTFDDEANIHASSTAHTRASTKSDEKKVMTKLVKTSTIFDYVPGRCHKTFSTEYCRSSGQKEIPRKSTAEKV